VYQLREFRRRLGASTGTVTVSVQFSVKDVLEQATELLASLDLEGIAREPFVPTYPLFGLHDADGRLVCTQAGTDRIAFVFTSEALAAAFATALRHGRAVRIADDAAAFKVLLKLGASNAVAFDPLFASGRVEVTTLVPVATILAR